MQSQLLKEIDINELQPTDLDLSQETLKYYASTFPLLENHNHPEVWFLNSQYYLVDGHHQIKDRLTTRNKTSFIGKCYTPENCGVGPEVYGELIDLILKKAKKAEAKGIKHISDLPTK